LLARTVVASRRRWLIPALVTSLLLLTPTLALAHLHLVRSAPAAGAVLDTVPRDVRLTFTEAAQLAVSFVDIIGAEGDTVVTGPLALDPKSSKTLVVPITGTLHAGQYSVRWRTTSDDGHPVRGTFTFTVSSSAAGLAPQQPTASAAGSPGATAAPASQPGTTPAPQLSAEAEFDASSPLYAALRALGFIGALGMIGSTVFGLFVAPRLARTGDGEAGRETDDPSSRAARLGREAAWLVVAVAIGRLIAQSYAVHGMRRAWDASLLGSMITGTVWGRAWVLCVIAGVLGIVAFTMARRTRRHGWGIAALASLALALSLALSGHAVATPNRTALAIVADVVHVLAAGGWLGTLLTVVLAGIPAVLAEARETRGARIATLVQLFSPVALTCAAALVITGVIAAWLHLGSFPALWSSSYGRVLILKLVLVAIVLGFGAFNWRVLSPALGDERAAGGIRRSAARELTVGLLVLIVTAVLVALPPPAEQAAAPVVPVARAVSARPPRS
jgi:copper transport protein